MKIKLLDGSVKEVQGPIKVKDFAKTIALSLGKATIGAILNKSIFVSSDFILDQDYELELITDKSTGYDFVLSTTAAAISGYVLQKLYPEVELSEFFYNKDELEFGLTFNKTERLKLDQLPDLQKRVTEIIKGGLIIKNQKLTATTGLVLNEYQNHLAERLIESQGFFILTSINDLTLISQWPVATEPNLVKVIQLTQLTGSYWLDDAENIMLQRIHGLTAANINGLAAKQTILEERRSRDHRNINKVSEIFDFDNLIGPGLPLWLPNGTVLKETIKAYLKEKEWEYEYVPVETPVIGTLDLYKTSGHLEHYRDDMFQPFKGGNESFVLRPMTCPHHIVVYRQQQHSYRELPIRYAEHALLHRYESSGSLTGLERVRAMELTDSHIFVRPDQVETEFKSIYQLIDDVLTTFKIEIDYLSFSVRDRNDKEKFFDDDKMWDDAEEKLENVLKELKLPYKKMVGEAAFYGPKLDIQIKTPQSHEITVSTIQLDFLLPQRFNLSYIDENGEHATPIIIHRGLIGTYERFIATLLEQTKGVLPLWLAPVQVEIIPLGDDATQIYASGIREKLKSLKIRSHLDLRDERLSYKIRDAQVHKIPYQLVIGTSEVDSNTITYRKYGTEEQITVSVGEFIDLIDQEIKEKK